MDLYTSKYYQKKRSIKMKNYTQTKKIALILTLSLLLIYSIGCTKTETPIAEPNTIAIGEPNPSTPIDSSTSEDSTSETSPKISEEGAKAMQLEKSIQDILLITLKDIEGNVVKDDFSDAEMQEILVAFNDSFIMDTAYIEMITGYTMDILLKDGQNVFIHSYGDPNYIVASNSQGETYHLGCEVIAKMLLDTSY